jgi:hypothetical protein
MSLVCNKPNTKLHAFPDFMFFMFQAFAMPPGISASSAKSWKMKNLKGSRHEGSRGPGVFDITLDAFVSFMIFMFKASEEPGTVKSSEFEGPEGLKV